MAVITAMVARGMVPRAGVFHSSKALPSGVSTVKLDLADRSTFRSALEGVAGLFLLRPPAISNVKESLNVLVDAAREAGVGHIVFLSVIGADRTRYIPHYAVERHVERSGVPYTFLRAGFFAQNFCDAYRADICEHDRIYVPAGDGKVAFVDVRDLGEVAAAIFASPHEHRNIAYLLSGPAAVTFDDVAALLTRQLGRTINYRRASVVGYLRHLRRRGLPWTQVLVQCALHVGLRFGQAEGVDPTLEKLLGRPPRSMAEFIADHRALWNR